MRDHILLYVNGRPVEVRGPSAFQTLARYLRSQVHATGTKIVCDEGDCGACTVLVGRPHDGQIVYWSVNACIQHVFQVDGAHVVTVEGLAENGCLSAIQEQMVVGHGAQCGFCTPGFITSMAGLFEETDRPTEADVRTGLTGNLCRCTGYDPIIRAALAVDPARHRRLDALYPPDEMRHAFARSSTIPIHIETQGRDLAAPVSLDDAVRFKANHPEVQIVQGGTDFGVRSNKQHFRPPALLSLHLVPGLDAIEVVGDALHVGARVTLSQLEAAVRHRVPAFYEILSRFGSPQIRHAATLAGNVANGSPIADTLPFLYVMEAEVELTGLQGRRDVAIGDLFKGYKDLDVQRDELITRVRIPLPAAGETLRLFKVSKRRDLDIATFTAAMRMTLDAGRIGEMRIAYGGAAPVVLRLPRTEAFLRGRAFQESSFVQAGAIARDEIAPISDVRGSRDFRLLLAETLLMKFYHESSEAEVPA